MAARRTTVIPALLPHLQNHVTPLGVQLSRCRCGQNQHVRAPQALEGHGVCQGVWRRLRILLLLV